MADSYVSFPQRPPDDAVPAISKLYHTVHRRLASIVSITTATAALDAAMDEPQHVTPLQYARDDESIDEGKEVDGTIMNELSITPYGQAKLGPEISTSMNKLRERHGVRTLDALNLNSKTLLQAARKAEPSIHSEIVTVQADLEYTDSLSPSPTRSSQESMCDPPNNSVPGFALQREVSSESETPPSPVRKRRPSLSREDSISTVLTRLKSGRLSKEFWMKDQNAFACFRCEVSFNAFRRKHHCRLCGQIFCANCTILTSGRRIQQKDRFRACKACNRIMDEYANMSSESDVDIQSNPDMTGSGAFETPPHTATSRSNPFSMPDTMKPVSTPLMAIPATRTPFSAASLSGTNQDSVEMSVCPVIVAEPERLPEIAQSKTDSDLAARHLQSSARASVVNWSQGIIGDLAGSATNPFRRGSISREKLEGDVSRQVSFSENSGELLQVPSNFKEERVTSEEEEDYWGGTIRIPNSRLPKTSPEHKPNIYRSPLPTDDMSLKRTNRRSVARHVRTKSKSLLRQGRFSAADSLPVSQGLETTARGRTRSRSNSVTQLGTEDLDAVSRRHLKALLQQMLSDAHIKNTGDWQTCLHIILMKIAQNIHPKVKEGASGYINNYVKIKRIPGSKPASCEFLSGAVFTHKLAHKQMPRTIKNPRIMLIAFPVEYYRTDSSQLMSLEPVLAQEKEYLENLVNRILALRPNLILVEKSISGLALNYLRENNVAVASLVKDSAMAIVSGLTGADIITSVDRLAFRPRLGKCEYFEVKTYAIHDAPEPFKKSYFFFRGCPPDLGCSVVLRGGDLSLLESIKRIVEFMVFVVYNLKLETSLLRDQFATQKLIGATESLAVTQPGLDCGNEALLSMPIKDALQIFEQRCLSASPGVHFPPPHLVKKAADLETKLAKHKAYLEYLETDELLENPPEPIFFLSDRQQKEISDLALDQQENIKKLMEAAEQRKLNQELQHCKSQWKTLLEREVKEHRLFACPQDRQGISVLYSAVCTATGTPCTMPTTEVIEFYKDMANDWPLGQYIEDSVYMAQKPCPTVLCGRKNMEHHRSYVHAQARVSVIVEAYACPLQGMQNSILMWNYCKICDSATPLMTMSENTWGYSFGKYLELTYFNRDVIVKADKCSHNLYQDHVKYFGFRDMAIRFDYDPIEIMGLALPQPFVDWQPDTFVRLKNEEYKAIQFKITAFYDSLEFRLYNMNSETLVIEQVDAYKADLAQMRQKAKDERLYLLNLLQEIFENSAPLDYLCLNRALRVTQDKVTSWNGTFDEMERLYLPSEKDIRRLTTAHLKKLFSLDDGSRISIGDDESHGEVDGKRSVSAPNVPAPEHEKMLDEKSDKERPDSGLMPEMGSDRTVSMPVVNQDSEAEPRGFHPRRTYEIVKTRSDVQEDNGMSSSSEVPAINVPASSKVQSSTVRKPILGPRTISSEDVAPRSTIAIVRANNRSPSVDLKPLPLGGLSPLKGFQDPLHLRKKSLTNNHVLSKQMQDIGESIVDSVEKRWNEQKKFSTQSKDQPQRNRAGETKVTSLAKHFEQLTREFEKERLKARRTLQSRGRPTFAVATQKPTVAVFDNVSDAVDQLSDEEEPNLEPLLDYGTDVYHFSNPVTHESTPNRTPIVIACSPGTLTTREIPEQYLDSQSTKANMNSVEAGKLPDNVAEKKFDTESTIAGLVPTAERNTLMKTLSNFWADRSSSNWTPLEYPLPPSEHMFLESDVVVREDEPSSLIAFTLSAQEYITEIKKMRDAARRKPTDLDQSTLPALSVEDRRIRAILQNPTGTHMRFGWGGDKSSARLTSRIFYAEQFDALRRFCGCDENYIASLSRCVKWDSSGGKSGSAFLKTRDDRLIVKQLSKIETEQFLRFAPNYFQYMSDNFFNKLPVSLSKILGLYQITSKNPVTGRVMKMDVIVMENLFYKRSTTRIFDLKGSMRNRKVQQTGRMNEVLLDENFVELVSENPLFVRDHARRFLKSALHNDTLFLAQNNVMDYSLIIGVDDERHELIVGIIDFIRTYTWDKKLESWVKERGLVGGGSNKPTVVTPKMYKTRFREAMDRYIFGIK